MRKVIFFTFTALVLANLFSFYVAYRITQKDMLQATEEFMQINLQQEESSTVFQLSKTDYDSLNWTNKGKVFRYNGRLFDISQIIISDSSIQLYVEESKKDTPTGPDRFVSAV